MTAPMVLSQASSGGGPSSERCARAREIRESYAESTRSCGRGFKNGSSEKVIIPPKTYQIWFRSVVMSVRFRDRSRVDVVERYTRDLVSGRRVSFPDDEEGLRIMIRASRTAMEELNLKEVNLEYSKRKLLTPLRRKAYKRRYAVAKRVYDLARFKAANLGEE